MIKYRLSDNRVVEFEDTDENKKNFQQKLKEKNLTAELITEDKDDESTVLDKKNKPLVFTSEKVELPQNITKPSEVDTSSQQYQQEQINESLSNKLKVKTSDRYKELRNKYQTEEMSDDEFLQLIQPGEAPSDHEWYEYKKRWLDKNVQTFGGVTEKQDPKKFNELKFLHDLHSQAEELLSAGEYDSPVEELGYTAIDKKGDVDEEELSTTLNEYQEQLNNIENPINFKQTDFQNYVNSERITDFEYHMADATSNFIAESQNEFNTLVKEKQKKYRPQVEEEFKEQIGILQNNLKLKEQELINKGINAYKKQFPNGGTKEDQDNFYKNIEDQINKLREGAFDDINNNMSARFNQLIDNDKDVLQFNSDQLYYFENFQNDQWDLFVKDWGLKSGNYDKWGSDKLAEIGKLLDDRGFQGTKNSQEKKILLDYMLQSQLRNMDLEDDEKDEYIKEYYGYFFNKLNSTKKIVDGEVIEAPTQFYVKGVSEEILKYSMDNIMKVEKYKGQNGVEYWRPAGEKTDEYKAIEDKWKSYYADPKNKGELDKYFENGLVSEAGLNSLIDHRASMEYNQNYGKKYQHAIDWANEVLANPESVADMKSSAFITGFTKGDSNKFLPIVGTLQNIENSWRLKQIADKPAEKRTEVEKQLLAMSDLKRQSDKMASEVGGWWYDVGKMSADSVPFVAEFVMTGGAFKMASAATKKAVRTAMAKSLNARVAKDSSKLLFVKKGVPLTIAEKGVNGLALLAGVAAQTTMQPWRIADNYIERMTPEYMFAFSSAADDALTKIDSYSAVDEEGKSMGLKMPDEAFGEAFLRAFGVTGSEVLTERIGAYLPGLGKKGINLINRGKTPLGKMVRNEDMLKRISIGTFMRKMGMDSAEEFTSWAAKNAGWHGILGEITEELLNYPLSNLADGNENTLEGLFKYDQDGRRLGLDYDGLSKMVGSVGIMAGAFQGTGAIVSRVQGNRAPVYYVNNRRFSDWKNANKYLKTMKNKGLLNKDLDIEIRNDFMAFDEAASFLEKNGLSSDMIKGVPPSKNKIIANEIEILEALSAEQGETIREIDNQLEQLHSQKNKIKGGKQSARSKAKEIEAIQDKIKELTTKKNEIIKPVEQDIVKRKTSEQYRETVKNVKAIIDKNKKIKKKLDFIESKDGIEAEQKALESLGLIEKSGEYVGKDGKLVNEIGGVPIDEIIAEMKTSHGFIIPANLSVDGKSKIIINEDVAISEKGGNVAGHEFFHFYLNEALNKEPELKIALGQSFQSYLANIDPRTVRNSEFRNRLNTYSKQPPAVQNEEAMALFLDGIASGAMEYNESVMSKIGNIIRHIAHRLGFEIELDNGRDVYNFIKDFNSSIQRGDLSKSLLNAFDKKLKIGDAMRARTAEMKETVKKRKQALKEAGFSDSILKQFEEEGVLFSKKIEDSKPAVDKLGANWTKPSWTKSGADLAIKEIKSKKLLDGLIAAKYKVRPVPSDWVSNVLNSPEFTNHVRNFNPEINDSLFGWINSQLRNKATGVFNLFKKGEAPVGTKQIDAAPVEGAAEVQVEDTTYDLDKLTDNIDYFDAEVKDKSASSVAAESKFRKEIGIGNIGKSAIMRKAKIALTTADIVDKKGFLNSLEQNLSNSLYDTMNKILDPTSMKKYRKAILESIPIKTLVQMQKFLPEKIFIKDHGRATNLKQLTEFVEKGLLPREILNDSPESKKRRAAGVKVYERLDTTTKQFEDYIDAPAINPRTGKRSGTRGNNRIKLLSEAAKSIGKDAIPESLTKDFIEDYLDIKDLKDRFTVDEVIEKITEQIDRPRGLMFSKAAENIEDTESSFVEEIFQGDDIKTADKLSKKWIKEGIFKHKTKQEIDKFFEDVENILIPTLPKGLITKTVLRPSNRILPNKGKDLIRVKGKDITIDEYYTEKRDKLLSRTDLKYGKPFSGKGSEYKYGRTYANMFGKTEADIINSNKNGTIKNYNDIHKSMHEQFWQRVYNSLKSDPNNIKIWGNYFSLVGQDVTHPHRMGAEMVGWSTKPKGVKTKKGVKLYEWEHAMPATRAYLYLLNAAMGGYDFNASYELVMKDFKLIALDAAQDLKLKNAGRTTSMGKDWKLLDDSWLDRYFHEDVIAVRGGINPNSIMHVDEKTFAEKYNIKADGASPIIMLSKPEITRNKNTQKAIENRSKYFKDGKSRGMSTFDFDETVGVSENFIIANKGKETKRIASSEWPMVGDQLAKEGWKFDFTDFNKVTKGKPGPLFDKMKNQIKKYGPDNVFILTARAPESQKAIHDWLSSEGINIPIENVTGLGNSTGEAKANWMLEKFAEGYNDMYFVDDALPNVKAVKEVLDQLDIKSKVVQAKTKVKVGGFLVDVTTQEGRDFIKQYNSIVTVRSSDPKLANQKIKFSKNADRIADGFNNQMKKWREGKGKDFYEEMKKIPTIRSSEFKRMGGWIIDTNTKEGKEIVRELENIPTVSSSDPGRIKFSKSVGFNKMLETTKGVAADKKFSLAEARRRGRKKGKNIFKNFFIPPSAEDFKGLLYAFLGKGKQGDADLKWFKKHLLQPYAEGIRDWNTYKQNMSNEYAALKKEYPDVTKILNKEVKGTNFTNDTAIRVYLWNKNGMEIPGISKAAENKLVNHVRSNDNLKNFAEALSVLSRRPEGYIAPENFWMVQSIAADLNNITNKIGRQEFIREWIENKNEIFSPENLNKIEAIYGEGFRDALENMLYRMEHGTNRVVGKDKIVNKFLNWINGSVGAVMFFNIRSAALQTISTVNFINWADNNIFKAAAAFANQPQFWKDFAFIFNSDMLKQRRAGLQIDVNANELSDAFSEGRSKPEAVIRWLLEKGFKPTQIADSFAIAMGGAPFYRNRLNTYLKQGLSENVAKQKAWLDFQEIAEETQQSSRPDLISMQQAGVLGRIILAWQNTPMQMTRLTKKALSDIVNGRGDMKSNISRVIYYGVLQNLIFGALQTGLAFLMFGSDEDEEKKRTKELRVANGALDTLLRGTGVYGAMVSTIKNTILKWQEENAKPHWKKEDSNIFQEMINLSPPLGSKFRKIMAARRTEKYNEGVGKKLKWRIENPNLSIAANIIEALTNAPVARIVKKANHIEEALTGNHELWQRLALLAGWDMWSVDVKDEELQEAKEAVKEEREAEKKAIKEAKKEEKKKQKEAEKKDIEEKKKKEGIKKVRCSAIKSNGQRCNMMVETKNKTAKCIYHKELTDKEKKEGTDRDNDGIREFRCVANKKNGERCKNRTENKNKKCYAHQ